MHSANAVLSICANARPAHTCEHDGDDGSTCIIFGVVANRYAMSFTRGSIDGVVKRNPNSVAIGCEHRISNCDTHCSDHEHPVRDRP
jgi:hypothetical protein